MSCYLPRLSRRGAPFSLRAGALAAGLAFAAPGPVLAQAPGVATVTMDAVTVSDKALPQVYSEASGSYVPQAVEVGKTAQSLREIAQSVTVVTRQRMDDQALRTLDDVMAQTTGVTREETWLDTAYQSRGLNITNFRYDGGAVTTTRSGSRSLDMAQFDSVTLLRGADGLFGAGEAGGVINFTSKRPLAQRQTQLLLSGGTLDNYRADRRPECRRQRARPPGGRAPRPPRDGRALAAQAPDAVRRPGRRSRARNGADPGGQLPGRPQHRLQRQPAPLRRRQRHRPAAQHQHGRALELDPSREHRAVRQAGAPAHERLDAQGATAAHPLQGERQRRRDRERARPAHPGGGRLVDPPGHRRCPGNHPGPERAGRFRCVRPAP